MSVTRCRLYEKGWKYTPAASTDIRTTFRRIAREQAKEAEDAKAVNVRPIKRKENR